MAMSARAEPAVPLPPTSFMDLPGRASVEEIRARSWPEHRAYLQMLVRNMRANALVPAGNHGSRPAVKQEDQLSRRVGKSMCALLQSLAIVTAQDLRCSSLLLPGPLVRSHR